MLWQGDLSLASSGHASFSQRKQDSFACEASRQPGRAAAHLNTSLTVNLGRGYSRDELVPVTVEWTRPMTDQRTGSPACDGEEMGS